MKIENCKLKNANCRGFSLIELIVTMAIMGILASAAVVNFARNDNRDVQQERERLVSFVRQVQNMSLTTEKKPGAQGKKICGFSLKMDGPKVQAYYAYSENIDDTCSGTSHAENPLTDDAYLPKDSEMTVALENIGKIYFSSPYGIVTILSDDLVTPVNSAIFKITKGEAEAQVSIDDKGVIK